MADSIDSLMKEVAKLRKVLFAQQSGIPDRLTVLVTGRAATSPEGVKRAVLARLADYGLDDESQAEEAGCTVTAISLPWLDERQTRREVSVADDLHDTSKTAINSVQNSVNGLKAYAGNNSFSLGMGEDGKKDDLS